MVLSLILIVGSVVYPYPGLVIAMALMLKISLVLNLSAVTRRVNALAAAKPIYALAPVAIVTGEGKTAAND